MKRISIFLLIIISLTISTNAQKRAFTLDDIYRVKGVGALSLSPSGKSLAYTVTESFMKEGKSLTAIYVMDTEKKISSKVDLGEKSVYSPFRSTSDNILYFTKTVAGNSQVFSYDFKTKAVKQITTFYPGIAEPLLSPDGKTLAFTSNVYPDCGADSACNRKAYEAAEDGPIQAAMSDDLLFRHWNAYSEGRVNHIFLQDLQTGVLTDITPYNYNCPVFTLGGSGYAFSPDSKLFCYVANADEKAGNSTNADLWLYDIAAKQTKDITSENKAWDGTPAFSPDGKYIAYRTQKVPGYESDKFVIALYDIAAQKSKRIGEKFDNWVDDIKWLPDSKTICFQADQKSFTPLFTINIATEEIVQITPDRAIGDFELDATNINIYYTYRQIDKPAEIYLLDVVTQQEKQLTTYNKALLAEVDFRPAEDVWVKGADGTPIHVMLIKPHDFDPKKKYPVIINVHGGPQSQWMNAYRPDAQLYGGYGYIVALPNPHGSTGYGQAFTKAISGDWGGKVYKDVMLITDYIEKLSYVDKNRIGAMGWSYGGYMMNWLQANTKRYKCLASMMGVYNLSAMYGTTEELWFPEHDLNGTPWDNKPLYDKWSPSNYVKKFSTPTLIITGERDYRVSYNQSLEYFTDLKRRGIDARIIIFKNDGHWPSAVKSMPLYYNSHLEWFHKYLGGKEAPYDSKLMVRNQYK